MGPAQLVQQAARKRAAAAAAAVAVLVVVGCRHYNAAEMVEVADSLVLADHKPVVVLAVVERRQRSSAGQAEVADSRVQLPSKDPQNIRKRYTRNEVDAQKETHRLLYRAQQDLHRCSAGDARIEPAFHIGWAEES